MQSFEMTDLIFLNCIYTSIKTKKCKNYIRTMSKKRISNDQAEISIQKNFYQSINK